MILLIDYIFDPENKSIEINYPDGFEIVRLKKIINVRSGEVLFDTNDKRSTLISYVEGATANVVVSYNTLQMSSSDPLRIEYSTDASSAGGGGGTSDASAANQVALNTAVGTRTDVVATTDSGTWPIISLVKRALQYWNTLHTKIPTVGQKLMAESIPVTLASNQGVLTTKLAETPTTTSGNIVSSGGTVLRALDGASAAVIQFTGNYTGVSLSFEASFDNSSTYYPVTGYSLVDSESGSFIVNPVGFYRVFVPGATHVRVRTSALATGTLTVAITNLNNPFIEPQTTNRFFVGNAGLSSLGLSLIVNSSSLSTVAGVDVQNYNSFTAQIIGSAGISAGAVIFEGSHNNVTFTPLTVYDDAVVTGAPIITAQTIAANANRFFSGKTSYRYVRCRISTAFVGGTVQGIFKFSDNDFVPRVATVANPTAANLQVTGIQAGVWTVQPGNSVNTSPWLTREQPSATVYKLISAASLNANLIAAGARRVTAIHLFNNTGTNKYVKLYNKGTAPVVGSDIPVVTFGIQGYASVNIPFSSPLDAFSLGLGIGITIAPADSDNTAVASTDVILMISYI